MRSPVFPVSRLVAAFRPVVQLGWTFQRSRAKSCAQIHIFKMADLELQRNCQLIQQQLLAQGISFVHTEQVEPNCEGSSCDESRPASPTTHQVGLAARRSTCQPSDDADLIELIQERRSIWDTSCRSFKETPKKQQAWKEIAGKLGQDGMTTYILDIPR